MRKQLLNFFLVNTFLTVKIRALTWFDLLFYLFYSKVDGWESGVCQMRLSKSKSKTLVAEGASMDKSRSETQLRNVTNLDLGHRKTKKGSFNITIQMSMSIKIV